MILINLTKSFTTWVAFLFTALLIDTKAFALEFPLPPAGRSVVGAVQTIQASGGDTLGSIGQRYDIGYVEMAEANPDLDPDRALGSGTEVVVPTRFVLPNASRTGIVINLAELRLYYYPPNRHVVVTMPLGIGREGWETPVGVMHITSKIKNPTWHPTKSVRDDAAEQGYFLPTSVPPGPDNPLGKYKMRIGNGTYLIHGTNKPEGVGRRSSAGCMRMYPEDVEFLFKRVAIGTPVQIVDQPYKVAWEGNQLYLEAHMPLQERLRNDGSDFAPMVGEVLRVAKQRTYRIDWEAVKATAETTTGIPQRIGYSHPVSLGAEAFNGNNAEFKVESSEGKNEGKNDIYAAIERNEQELVFN